MGGDGLVIGAPKGWGVGINVIERAGGAYVEDVAGRVRRAMAVLRPAWFQTWDMASGLMYRSWTPAAEAGWAGERLPEEDEIAAVQGRTLLVLNEPERGWSGLGKPEDAALRSLRSVWRMARFGTCFHWAGPGCNINGDNMDWLEAYAAELWARGGGMPTYWAVHLYSTQVDWAETHLARFWLWHRSHGGGRPVVFTECGAGGEAMESDHLRMMPWFADLLSDKRVLGVAYFAAYGYEDKGKEYVGVMESEQLLRMWQRCQRR